MEMRITIRETTTMSSTKVKPRLWRGRLRPPRSLGTRRLQAGCSQDGRPHKAALPLRVCGSIGSFLLRLAVDVEDALTAPGEALGVVLIAAQSPLGLAGERIHRNPAQEAHLLAVRTG